MIESIHQAFSLWMLRICVSGLVALAVVLSAIGIGRLLGEKVRRLAKAGALAIIMACVAVYATLTNGYPTNEDKEEYRQLQQRQQQELRALGGVLRPTGSPQTVSGTGSQRQSRVDATPRTVPHWAHGVYLDGERIDFGDGWVFPHGTNHLSSVEVMPWGDVLPDGFADSPIASFGTRLSLVPGVSQFLYGQTPSNSCVFTWENAREGRVNGTPFNGRIELFRNGDAAVSVGGSVTYVPRTLPFAHDGFGQDEDWVRANFTRLQSLSPSLTNAEEIISIGYADWVDAQVDIGLTNGLYKFTATFTEDPPETTLLTVGDYSIAVTHAGAYSFVMEKGREYEFRTEPYLEGIDYSMQDDLLVEGEAPMLMSWWGGSDTPGEWSVDGGWHWLYYPESLSPGWFGWMPTLRGSPGVDHIGPNDQGMTFEAILSDCSESVTPSFLWTASNDDVHFTSPNAQSTGLTFDSFPSWSSLALTVQANLGGYSLWSSLYPTYGTNDHPVASFAMTAPEVVFLNDDGRTTRWYRVSVKLSCPVETNAIVSITHMGETGAKFASDPIGANCFALTNVELSVSSDSQEAGYQFYCACTNLGSGTFSAACVLPGGEVLSDDMRYRVIEPLQKLVCNDEVDGGYYNPSRLIYGTNIWLKVFARGAYSSSEVQWRIVSGPGRITKTQDWAASVEPTASEGEVVVEAAFGKDELVQPRFVLPIVQKRRVAVCACIVSGENETPVISSAEVERKIRIANEVYSQVGIEYYLSEPVVLLNDATFRVLSEHNVRTNADGRVTYWGVCPQVTNMFARVQTTATIQMFWVSRIVNGTPLAFTVPDRRCCVFANNPSASDSVVPHEFGHAMGLKDIYNRRKKNPAEILPNSSQPVSSFVFDDVLRDWTPSDGRGFYEKTDTHYTIIQHFLMNGRDAGGKDIPSSSVEGYGARARHIFDTDKVNIGASNIRED